MTVFGICSYEGTTMFMLATTACFLTIYTLHRICWAMAEMEGHLLPTKPERIYP